MFLTAPLSNQRIVIEMATKPTGKPVGRPSNYSEEVIDKICERMINGEDLVAICLDETMPARSTVYKWMDERPELWTRLTRAREGLGDFVAWKILDMADKTTNDTANADRVKLAAWQWHAARLAPKRYSEKQMIEHTGADGGAIKTETAHKIDADQLEPEQRDVLKTIFLSALKTADK